MFKTSVYYVRSTECSLNYCGFGIVLPLYFVQKSSNAQNLRCSKCEVQSLNPTAVLVLYQPIEAGVLTRLKRVGLNVSNMVFSKAIYPRILG